MANNIFKQTLTGDEIGIGFLKQIFLDMALYY